MIISFVKLNVFMSNKKALQNNRIVFFFKKLLQTKNQPGKL